MNLIQIMKLRVGVASFVFMFLLILSFNNHVEASKIDSKIYKSIYNYSACVLLTNATHQVGCTSKMKGNQGVLHLVNTNADVEFITGKGTQGPYVPLLNNSMFIEPVMKKLMDSNQISGVLVIHDEFSKNPDGGEFSPDTSCPMDNFGMYSNNTEYGSCKKIKWNPIGNGMSFVYYGVPIFLLQNNEEIESLVECFRKYNRPHSNGKQSYPLCSVEMKDFMFAAKDTPTCRRKTEMGNPIQNTYCDPLGDSNIFGTLLPTTGKLPSNDVIMVTTKMDSTGFFHDHSLAVDNGVTGIVTLLSVAYALGEYKRKMIKANKTEELSKLRPIAFTLFNGESWDYIGSSKMVYDMENNAFPSKGDYKLDDPKLSSYASKIKLENLAYFIEIGQVGVGNEVYAHTDPISQENQFVKDRIDTILDQLSSSARNSSTDFNVVDRSSKQPLPPASFQRFLRSRKDIAGVVLTDHETSFSNKYYNSRFDNAANLDIKLEKTNGSFVELQSPILSKLANLSETIANAVYLLASDGQPPSEKILVPRNMSANLLYCLVYAANCPSFKEILGRKSGPLPTAPLSRYISVNQLDNPITQLLNRLLSYYTGEWLPEANCTKALRKKTLPEVYSYDIVQGSGPNFTCVRSSVYNTPAVSPAFELMDYTSTDYSTWAESMWYSDIGIQMYLKGDPAIEGVILGSGIVIFIISFGAVYFINKKATTLFSPNVLVING